MNKLFTKIAGSFLGLSMAIGVGVAAGTNHDVIRANADTTGSYTFTFDANTKNDGTGSSLGSDHSTALTTSNIFTYGTYTFKSGSTYYWLASGSSNVQSVSQATNCYPGANSTLKVGKAAGDGVLNFTVSGDTHLSIDSVAITAYGGDASTKITVAEATSATKTWTLSTSSGSHTFTYSSAVKTVSITGGKGLTSKNKAAYISQIVVNYTISSGDAPTLTGVSVTGNMSTTTYNTVQAWSNSGLTATANYSDSTSTNVTDTATWSYSPATPAAAVLANSNEEVTGLSVSATATFGGESGSKATSGISVSFANVAQGLAAVPNANDQIDNVIVKGTISYINSIDTTQYHNATYYISDDGSRTDELEIYRGKGLNNVDFTNSNDIKVGDIVLVYGNIKYYNGTTKEFLQGNYLLNLDRPASSDPSITITEDSFQMNVGDADVTLHETHENVPEGGSVKWVSGTPATATIGESTGVVHAVASGTTEITAKIVDSNDQTVASNSITITVIEPVLRDGDSFEVYYGTLNSDAVFFTGVNSDNIGTYSSDESDAVVFTAIEGETSGQFAFSFNGVFLSYSGSSNKVYTSETNNSNATLWTVTNNGTYDIIESVNVAGRHFKYNTSSGQERFCCYTSDSNIHIKKIVVSDPTTLTLDTKTLSLEAEEVSDALTFTTDSPSAAFAWYSEDTSKATVANGVVTAGTQTGTTVKIYVYFDTDGSGDFDPAEDLNDYCTITIVAPSIDYSAVTYGGTGVKITSTNASTYLVNGKKIIMTYNDTYVAGSYGSYMEAITPSNAFNNDEVKIGDGTSEVSITVLELETATGGFYLKTKDGKYLSNTSSGSSAGNFSKTDTATTVWSVSDTGIYDVAKEDIATIMFNNSANPKRFKPYKSNATVGGPVVVYSFNEYIDEAETYADLFLESGLCGTNDNTKADSDTWLELEDTFENDLSAGAQNVLKTAIANKDSTDSIQKCLARYDRVIYLHYHSEPLAYPDFMDRVANDYVVPLQGSNLLRGMANSSNTIAIVLIVSLVSITAVGGYFLLKKKKEQ